MLLCELRHAQRSFNFRSASAQFRFPGKCCDSLEAVGADAWAYNMCVALEGWAQFAEAEELTETKTLPPGRQLPPTALAFLMGLGFSV